LKFHTRTKDNENAGNLEKCNCSLVRSHSIHILHTECVFEVETFKALSLHKSKGAKNTVKKSHKN